MGSIGWAVFPPWSSLYHAVTNPAARHCSKISHGFAHLVLRQSPDTGTASASTMKGVFQPGLASDAPLHCALPHSALLYPAASLFQRQMPSLGSFVQRGGGRWKVQSVVMYPHQEGRVGHELDKHPPGGSRTKPSTPLPPCWHYQSLPRALPALPANITVFCLCGANTEKSRPVYKHSFTYIGILKCLHFAMFATDFLSKGKKKGLEICFLSPKFHFSPFSEDAIMCL